MRHNEARILIYLDQVRPAFKVVKIISAKLDIDFSNLCKVLNIMKEKKWVSQDRYPMAIYWNLTRDAPVREAKKLIKEVNKS